MVGTIIESGGEPHEESTNNNDMVSLPSVLSADDMDDFYTEDDDSTWSAIPRTWDQKWQRLQERFSRRDTILEKLSESKSRTLVKLLRKRELIVRRQETDLLFYQHFCTATPGLEAEHELEDFSQLNVEFQPKDDHDDDHDDDCIIWYDACSTLESTTSWTGQQEEPLANTIRDRIADAALFIWYTTVPGLYALVIHCVLHSAFYDLVELLDDYIRQQVKANFPKMNGYRCSMITMFATGFVLIRASGYLYWWMNQADYNCIKFDYHNRLRLDNLDARLLFWVKQRPALQATIFTLGYYLVYNTIHHWYNDLFYLFFPNLEVSGICREGSEEECDPSKNPFFFRYWSWMLSTDDEAVTKQMMLITSIVSIVVCCLSIMALVSYGFPVFHKY